MKSRTIQFRLMLWYFATSALILAAFGAGSWCAMRNSMYHSIDRSLRFRLTQVAPFVQQHSLHTREQFQRAFSNATDTGVVGVFVQITDSQSQVLFASHIFDSHHIPALGAAPEDGSILLETRGYQRGWPMRVASQRFVVNGVPMTIHLIEPLRDTWSALREYTRTLCGLLLAALLLATATGYLFSRRAFRPVEQLRLEAEGIDPTNLSARLAIPIAEDELKRLAQTLNAMLSRIESGFRAVQQFTADASHELRTPLALILTATEVTLRRERSAAELRDTLLKVQREGRHMANLLEQLLTLARSDAQQGEKHFDYVDLTELTRELVQDLESTALNKGLELQEEVLSGSHYTRGDATELRRLLMTLLDNAIKYTDSGSIRVSLKLQEGEYIVSIADTGIGIRTEDLPMIFDRFWRADQVRSSLDRGAGLGLALASQTACRHHGRIGVQSQFGQGSTFWIRLPIANPGTE